MDSFDTMQLTNAPRVVAPDGSTVSVLLALKRGSMALFELAPGETSLPVAHHTVEEIWFCLQGRGEMWRRLADEEQILPLEAGVCLTLPVGTRFQFRSFGDEPLVVIGVTMPPWPGEGEAYPVEGVWAPTV
jgi:mannose-6-phosphate isomerase-like protein (cupin superfamily)